MGCCVSSPADDYIFKDASVKFGTRPPSSHYTPPDRADSRGSPRRTTDKKAAAAPPPPPATPDFGLGEHYEVLRLLGAGGTGETYLCRHRVSGGEVAVKFMRRPIPKVVAPMILQEIQIQAQLGEGHTNVISALEVCLTPSHVALVMEYASGGTLTQYVTDKWRTAVERGGLFLTEAEACYFFRQLVAATEYCHANRVVHRDLKLDNTLLDCRDPPRIKICDFGFAHQLAGEEEHLHTQIGTPVYMSPEIIRTCADGYDGRKVDVWACGVLLFVMLLGMFPFEHDQHVDPNTNDAQLEVWLQQIQTAWNANPRVIRKAEALSPPCNDLLSRIFEVDEAKRIDIAGIKAHPWYCQQLPQYFDAALEELGAVNKEISKLVASGSFRSSKRDDALRAIVDKASRPAAPGEGSTVNRVNLRRLQHRYSVLLPDSVAQVFEEEAAAQAAAEQEGTADASATAAAAGAGAAPHLSPELLKMYETAMLEDHRKD